MAAISSRSVWDSERVVRPRIEATNLVSAAVAARAGRGPPHQARGRGVFFGARGFRIFFLVAALASPRPYREDVNLGLILSAASKSAIAFLVWPLLRLTRPRLSKASTKFGRSRSASLQSFSAACRSPITVRAQQRLL